MHIFEINKISPGFPESVNGILVPDLGEPGEFFQYQARQHPDTPDNLIALFINEFQGSCSIPDIQIYGHQNRLVALVTFGVLENYSEIPIGSTHFENTALELKIPFVQLVKPEGYPRIQKDWLDMNPLRGLYHSHVTLRYDSPIVGIEPTAR